MFLSPAAGLTVSTTMAAVFILQPKSLSEKKKIVHPQISKVLGLIFSLWYRSGRVWLKVFLCGFLQYVRGRCQGLVSNDCGINSYVTESSQAGPNLWGSRTMQCLFPLPAGDSCGHSSQCGQENPPRPPDWRYCGL